MNLKKELSAVAEAASKIMDEALKGQQHKIDANKNGKVDADDFAKLRAQKEKEKSNSMKFGKDVKEETEQIDEISKTTLNNYLKGVKKENDPRIHGDSAGSGNQMSKKARSLGRTEQDKEDGRYEGQKLAKRKLGAPGTIPAKVMAREETEQIDELSKDSYKNYLSTSKKLVGDHAKGSQLSRYGEYGAKDRELNTKNAQKHAMKKLIEELLNELEFDKNGRYVHKAKPPAKDPNAGVTDWDDEEKRAKQFTSGKGEKKPTARKKYGARQNYIRSTRVNESFSDLLGVYKEHGLKGLAEAMIKEEPTNDQYNAELEDNKAKAEGKKKQPELAKGSVQAVKQEEVEVIDANEVNGVQIDTIEERQMTEPEMKKREEIVKGMKKGLEGFKQRYGERAKSVMYATATKQAMK